jgi:hypothetical protein
MRVAKKVFRDEVEAGAEGDEHEDEWSDCQFQSGG